ncbi:hypothetical protein [Rugosimonospora africana]|uniref:Carboxypeptidase regulatory-like domain-containing protein n=1 Tax=Rugosimonospora africana TaxID=556532 RepID=A0A8J3QZT8_9ACTN|nr:hypothetical protein [Rugosimonospora africana]GIH17631.1 hypothetical protein Raf01_58030 [Rugosimonospora africana]
MTPGPVPAPLDEPGSDEPIDDLDLAILAGLADLYRRADPVPAGLVERIQFAVDLDDLDVEVCRLRDDSDLVPAGARGQEESRTVTFDSTNLTIMITISVVPDDTVRLDGWLAPPAALRVELRTTTGHLSTDADERGRFVIESVPRGLAQLVVRTPADGTADDDRSVVTPSIVM